MSSGTAHRPSGIQPSIRCGAILGLGPSCERRTLIDMGTASNYASSAFSRGA